ncbi:MAG: TetR/AcrR family transcriptional regulator [Planctomycetota bacterium]|jgi:AcrR family transcriptional regulator
MDTLTRKQREIQEREQLILEVARKMLLKRGYLGVTMERIAQEIEYSKGTVYQHFSSKEDVLVALAGQTTRTRADLFIRGAAFNGNARERITAVGVADDLFLRLYPQHWAAEHIIRAASIQSKATRDRLGQLKSTEMLCFEAIAGILRDAVESGDLQIDDDKTLQSISYGLWSLSFGSHFIAASNPNLGNKGMDDEATLLNRNYHALLDGYGWRPLSTEADYTAVQERVQREVFPEESRRAGLL